MPKVWAADAQVILAHIFISITRSRTFFRSRKEHPVACSIPFLSKDTPLGSCHRQDISARAACTPAADSLGIPLAVIRRMTSGMRLPRTESLDSGRKRRSAACRSERHSRERQTGLYSRGERNSPRERRSRYMDKDDLRVRSPYPVQPAGRHPQDGKRDAVISHKIARFWAKAERQQAFYRAAAASAAAAPRREPRPAARMPRWRPPRRGTRKGCFAASCGAWQDSP